MPEAGPYEEATAKLLIMSWNPGSAVRALTQIIDDSGYHICILQESWPATAEALPSARWSFAHAADQTIVARAPAAVDLIAKDESPGRVRWCLAAARFPESRTRLAS